jgi:hypothetical protein
VPKPSEFFVGLLEFFAILLPGYIATAFLAPRVSPYVGGSLVAAPTTEAERWVLLLVGAYLVGNLLFHAGSSVDSVYDRVRKARLERAVAQVNSAPHTRLEGNAYDVWTNDRAFQQATLLRRAMLTSEQLPAMNTYKWARSLLLAAMPLGAEDVHRLEADSKLFRSAMVVCVLVAVVLVLEERFVGALLALVFTWPCFMLYFDRRLKSTSQAYIHVITLLQRG